MPKAPVTTIDGVQPLSSSMPRGGRPRLIVFSDDWGRHHSSAQRLAKEWLDRFDIEWIETIGTRRPGLGIADLARGVEKAAGWLRPTRGAPVPGATPRRHSPPMWPGFGGPAARRFNRRRLASTLARILGAGPRPLAIITTVPIVSDLAAAFPDQRWVYYCVDALHDWSGLDSPVLESMERGLVARCDAVIAASPELAARCRAMENAPPVTVISHGVDGERWRVPREGANAGGRGSALFFGAVDERVDPETCRHVAETCPLTMIGPHGRAPKALREIPQLELVGPAPWEELPALAARADVLVLPYRNDGTTAHLEPLKLKEYLATGLPVIAPRLRAVERWASALDIADRPRDFGDLVQQRRESGTPPGQLAARRTLEGESWAAKAAGFEAVLESLATAPRTVVHLRSCGGSGSGPEKTLLRSHIGAEGRSLRILNVFLIDPDDGAFGGVLDQAAELGASALTIHDRGPLDRSVLPQLLEILRRERAVILHGHDAKSNVLARLARRQAHCTLVSTAHGWVHRTAKTPLYDRIDRRSLRGFDAVIAVSREIAERLVRSGVPEGQVHVIPNGVEVPELPDRRSAGGPLRLGTVGRLEAEKGLEYALLALAELDAGQVPWELAVFGEGSLREELEARARSLGVADRVHFRGFEPDRGRIFRDLDVLLLPSVREGTPNALLEAMAHGVPAIASAVGGVPELIKDGVEALVIPPGDVETLARSVRQLAEDPGLRESLGRAARKRAATAHSFEGRMARVFDLYDQLVPWQQS